MAKKELEFLKKERAVRVYPGMIAVYPHFLQEESLSTEYAPKFNHCYAMNNSTVAFVDNELYVTPYTRTVMSTLRREAFLEKSFHVPFSNGDYPKNEKEKWNELLTRARTEREEEFVEECATYCDEHHIGVLTEATLRKCLQIPKKGVKVKHLYYEDTYYPIIPNKYLDTESSEKIGKYCTNNGRVVFVYRDGKTYVARGYKILNELRAAGFQESGLFVPFSNGEQILDPLVKLKWESIPKFS